MNWLRDNILKILIILGITVVVIVIVALVFKPKGDEVVSGTKYGELETKLQNAAIRYIDRHKKKLPTTTEYVTKIKLSTLISNNYIGKLVAIDNPGTKCDGYVEIAKISDDGDDYRYTPFISCGEYYRTKTIGDYIIDTETKDGTFERITDAGLYKIGDEYVFKGENVNNHILLDDHLYRIIKIDKDKSLQLISVDRTENTYTWDDRYNIEKNRDVGINTFIKSRLYEELGHLYENKDEENFERFFTTKEKHYIIEHDFCVGRRSLNDGSIYSGAECKETAPLKVGLISLNEYARASIDPNCKSVFDMSCSNYNFFSNLGKKSSYSYFTLTGVLDNTYDFYRIRYNEVTEAKASTSSQLYPVIYINSKSIYSSGTGVYTDPYVIR